MYVKHVEHCLVSVSCYLISSVSCGELISWEVGSPPVLFILKWSPSLLSENLSRVADVCTLLHVCVRVRVCVCVCLSLSCVTPAQAWRTAPVTARVPGRSPTLPGSPRFASSGCVHLNSCLVCLALLLSPLAGFLLHSLACVLTCS